jgi:predicted AAA+ superfamily ATPase
MRWDARSHTCRGITEPDPVRLHDLVGYDTAQAVLTRDVERFLNGLPAHDALLYGAPGTGKSSTVKAIANEFAARGLRLVEVRKEDLYDLPAIEAELRGRAPRFLLFVDDLSFEEHQTEYKALKALLEGSAEARPNNILIFATSNRRNIIRENFADRGSGDDVHGRDTLQEKTSLAARFGLRVTFAAPDQDCYLDIAEAIARSRRLPLDSADVRSRALAWERRHPGRSGRLARQFVDDLEGELNGINNNSTTAEQIP